MVTFQYFTEVSQYLKMAVKAKRIAQVAKQSKRVKQAKTAVKAAQTLNDLRGVTTSKKDPHPQLTSKHKKLQKRSDEADKRMATQTNIKKADSGSVFGKGKAMGSGVGNVTGNLARSVGSGVTRATPPPPEARDLRRKGRQAAIKLKKVTDTFRKQKPSPSSAAAKKYPDPKKAMRSGSAKQLELKLEEFSHWREDFVWEADKKYPSGEKEKIIDVMKGKNTIEVNPDEPDDKYSRK